MPETFSAPRTFTFDAEGSAIAGHERWDGPVADAADGGLGAGSLWTESSGTGIWFDTVATRMYSVGQVREFAEALLTMCRSIEAADH